MLKLIFLLKSWAKSAPSQRKKESRGRKDCDEQKECLHLALVCLKELIISNLHSQQLSGVIEDLASVTRDEYAGPGHECEAYVNTEDQHNRSKQMFIAKTLMPLFSDLLALSSFRDVEVRAKHTRLFRCGTFF